MDDMELADIRQRWHPDAEWTRSAQDHDDVQALLNFVDALRAELTVAVNFVADVAESERPVVNGLKDKAQRTLEQLGVQRSADTEARHGVTP